MIMYLWFNVGVQYELGYGGKRGMVNGNNCRKRESPCQLPYRVAVDKCLCIYLYIPQVERCREVRMTLN